jgi:hypothetical protein
MRVNPDLAPELKRLAADFRAWRKRKRHVREQIPEELLKRARLAIPVHGASAVAQAIGVEHARLTKGPRQRPARIAKRRGSGSWPASKLKTAAAKATVPPSRPARAPASPVPSYSRIELPMPSASPRPVAEVETPVGLKLKVFEVTPETVSLLSALTAAGRVP